jgi:hypothetical protein
MPSLTPLEIEPGVYTPEDDEYITLNALEGDDWTNFLDALAKDGRTALYDDFDNSYVVT